MGLMGDGVKAAEAAGIRDHGRRRGGRPPAPEPLCHQNTPHKYPPDPPPAADVAVELCK